MTQLFILTNVNENRSSLVKNFQHFDTDASADICADKFADEGETTGFKGLVSSTILIIIILRLLIIMLFNSQFKLSTVSMNRPSFRGWEEEEESGPAPGPQADVGGLFEGGQILWEVAREEYTSASIPHK
ncbi:1941_t:CDS:2 [Paraglomus occultum]|uniref:1941_t:CDS:1 n=1 Tax=Paraglomus occultum TaxID=144539 RepID=A0A9N9FXQ8_9GLOM|nr:1941_t:CDS:2 [Paraglomus occultum]